jgi:hypothetical protein
VAYAAETEQNEDLAVVYSELDDVSFDELSDNLIDNQVSFKEKRDVKKANREERLKFKEAIEQKREIVQENRAKNQAIRTENQALKTAIKEKLTALKESNEEIDPIVKEQIKAYHVELSAIHASMHETKGDIKELNAANKPYWKELNYTNLESCFSEVYEIQNFRYSNLQNVNLILNNILSLIP